MMWMTVVPKTQKVLPDGEEGELVFTTLTRQAMPLIRYRFQRPGNDIPRTALRTFTGGSAASREEAMTCSSLRGSNIFPLQIDTILMNALATVGTNYVVVLEQEDSRIR